MFALFPVIFIYSENIHLLPIQEIIIPVFVVVGATILFWFVSTLFSKNSIKSGLEFGMHLILNICGGKASKFSVVGLTKYYAALFGKNVNINCIVNGGIEATQPKIFKKKLVSHIPKNRMMRSSDLFGILDLLCSEKSNYINGSIIVIDGGYTSW